MQTPSCQANCTNYQVIIETETCTKWRGMRGSGQGAQSAADRSALPQFPS